jgi:hypothetical protein
VGEETGDDDGAAVAVLPGVAGCVADPEALAVTLPVLDLAV